MADLKNCPECGSSDLIPNIPVSSISAAGGGNLAVEVVANPDAMLFKGRKYGIINAIVCGSCGFVRLFAHNPQELLEAFREQK